ncbi:MAG: hypothetical protein Q8903_13685 [Bacteroidota bacterium]|nr:hypothetical protein [Bacteroidota bacterium]
MRRICIIFTLAFIVIAGGCSPKRVQNDFSSEQIKDLDNIPYNTRFLIYMNIEKLKTSSLWKNNLKSSLPGAQSSIWMDKFEKVSGIKLQQNISEFYAAVTENDNNFKLLVLNSNYKKIKNSFLSSDLFNHQTIGNKILLSAKDEHNYYYFITDKLLASSSDSVIIINLMNNKNKKITDNPKFMKAANSIFNKKYYWMASDDNTYFSDYLKMLSSSEKGMASELISSVVSFTIAADFKDESRLEFSLGCKDAKSAFLITSGAKSAISMGLLTHNDKALDFMFSKLKIERFESFVKMNLELTNEDIIQLQEINKNK